MDDDPFMNETGASTFNQATRQYKTPKKKRPNPNASDVAFDTDPTPRPLSFMAGRPSLREFQVSSSAIPSYVCVSDFIGS